MRTQFTAVQLQFAWNKQKQRQPEEQDEGYKWDKGDQGEQREKEVTFLGTFKNTFFDTLNRKLPLLAL